MLLTRHEVIYPAVIKTASILGIKDPEWKSIDELLVEIDAVAPDTYKLLNEFIDAFLDWFQYGEEIERDKKMGNLSPEETKELLAKSEKKDNARKAIIKHLKI